ncbi:MAG: crosslink repair DNA glycosylase YcaQ family protein [Marmoricola sp.]
MKTTVHLSKAQARRITLAAQGFRAPRHDPPTMRTLTRAVQRTGVLQVDSVNVLQRAHYMPLFARMGGYDVSLLKRANEGSPRRLVEYWAHVQALMPVDLWPVMQHRMAEYRANAPKWWGFALEHPELVKAIHGAVVERGAVTARDLETEFSTGPRSKEHWGWNWSATRKVLDYLYMVGDLAMAGRTDSVRAGL